MASNAEEGSRVRSTVRRIAVDVTPLRVSRDFRRLWLGLLGSQFGFQFTLVASFIQVYRLTDSAAAVGLIGAVGFLALIAGTLAGTGAGSTSAYEMQRRYDNGYQQCMYAKGHRVPVSGRFAAPSPSYISQPAASMPPPPPPGSPPPLPPR